MQWAGHAVCIVGAMRRRRHAALVERHLLLFNPERATAALHAALATADKPSAPYPKWWADMAWSATRTAGRRRIGLEEALTQPCPGNEKGPGGEDGPYQALHVPYGWVCQPKARARVKVPEQATIQYVGDDPPVRITK